MGSIDAVVFDMDGTLLDSTLTVPAAYAAAINELSGVRCTHEEVIAAYSAGPAAALLTSFIGRAATDVDVECWHRHLRDCLEHTTVYPGIPDALELLASSGTRLAVFTGATNEAARMQLEHADLARMFDVVIGSDEIAAVKPAPDGLVLACERMGVHPRRTAYVGDASNDVRCARAAGATAVAAAWGHLHDGLVDADITLAMPEDLALLRRA